jgi:hypothetical protein
MEFLNWWTMEWWNLPQNVSAQSETEEAAGERLANVFLHDRIFLGFWQRLLDPELGLLRNWEGGLNWVAVSFFEASTKTSVGSSDSQRISCASTSAAGIVVDGAHTNSRHWNCGPWCPPLGSRPLCKQPLHLFPSSLLPPLEKIKFCKLLSSSCMNAHKYQVILKFCIWECRKGQLVILEFFKVYLCNVLKMRWFWSSFFVSIFRWCWTMESCKWLSLSLKGSSLAWAMEVSRMCLRLVTRKQIEGNFETLIILLFSHFFSLIFFSPPKSPGCSLSFPVVLEILSLSCVLCHWDLLIISFSSLWIQSFGGVWIAGTGIWIGINPMRKTHSTCRVQFVSLLCDFSDESHDCFYICILMWSRIKPWTLSPKLWVRIFSSDVFPFFQISGCWFQQKKLSISFFYIVVELLFLPCAGFQEQISMWCIRMWIEWRSLLFDLTTPMSTPLEYLSISISGDYWSFLQNLPLNATFLYNP